MPRAGFNQHKLMPGPSCFGLHISSRNKSAEAPRAVQGLLGLEVAGTGWGWLWEPPGLRAWGRGCSEPTLSSVPRSWCQLCNAAPAWSGCASANNPNTQTMQMDSVGTKAFLLPGLGRAWRDPQEPTNVEESTEGEQELPPAPLSTLQEFPGSNYVNKS